MRKKRLPRYCAAVFFAHRKYVPDIKNKCDTARLAERNCKLRLPWKGEERMKYDVIIIGAGPGGIFSAYELIKRNEKLKIEVFESGYPLEKSR